MLKARIRVLIVDDHEIVRMGLRSLLDREHDIDVVGTSPSGEHALDLLPKVSPDVVVVDYSMPGMTGVEVCWEIRHRHSEAKVVMLTTYLDDAVIRSSIEAGAKAYVYKDVDGDDLKRAIRAVARGEALLHSKVTDRVIRWAQVGAMREAPLSYRELDILRLVAKGMTNNEIAASLNISLNTVKTCLSRAMRKLGCHKRSQAATMATRSGLL